MEESQNAEKVQLSTEELVQIANSLQAQNNQMNAMVKDLGAKIAKIEVEIFSLVFDDKFLKLLDSSCRKIF